MSFANKKNVDRRKFEGEILKTERAQFFFGYYGVSKIAARFEFKF